MLISANSFEHCKHVWPWEESKEVPNVFSAHFYNMARSSCWLLGLNEKGQGAHWQTFSAMGGCSFHQCLRWICKIKGIPPASLLSSLSTLCSFTSSLPELSLLLLSLISLKESLSLLLFLVFRGNLTMPPPFVFHLRHLTLLCHSREYEQPKFTALFINLKTSVIKECYELGIRENTNLLFDSWSLVDVDVYSGIAVFYSLSCFLASCSFDYFSSCEVFSIRGLLWDPLDPLKWKCHQWP